MEKIEAKGRIEKLKKLIEKYRYSYHVLDKPLVSDAVNDSLKHELQELEQKFPDLVTSDSPTQRVGGKPLAKFKKVSHKAPMLSLTDGFSLAELKDWEERNQRFLGKKIGGYFSEIKLDGLAVSLRYKAGQFEMGATRGDGRTGEDVTENLKTVEAIPLKIQNPKSKTQNFEVRGEVYMTKKIFEELNKKYKKQGKPLLANPRNGAAGSIRQLDPLLAAERKLSFAAYDIIGQNLKTHQDKHQLLRYLGFPTAQGQECKDLEEVEKFYQTIQKKRDRLPFQIDGIWVGVEDSRLFDRLGSIGKSPRAAIAYKFPAQEKTTIVKEVVNQVGRSGKVTPVAIMEPVSLAGSVVSRATLHNWQEIQKKDVRLADTVIIRKAGDIIPEVVKVVKELRPSRSKPLKPPTNCPNCGQKLARRKTEQVDLFCPNPDCGQVRQRQLEHLVSKKGFDIDGLGGKILEQIISQGLVCQPSDIFKLKQADLQPLERFAQKSAQNIAIAIEQAKKIPIERYIFSLGIRQIGEAAAAQIGQLIKAPTRVVTPSQVFQEFKKRSQDEWLNLPDMGPEAAESLTDYFSSSANFSQAKQLTQLGVKIILSPHLAQTLSGKTLVITGSLEEYSRQEAEKQIRLRGGQASSSVSDETDFLVLGDDPGSKLAQAQKLKIKIITEKQFLRMLGGQ